jgi:hypothetical protein
MNPLNLLDAPAAVVKAVTFPFHALFVVGLCFFINWFTSPGHWWAQWVAFGMTIALVCVWARAVRVLITTVGLAGGAYLVYRWWTGRKSKEHADFAGVDTMRR